MKFLEAPRRQEGIVRRMFDRLPIRRRIKKEYEIKDQLVAAFAAKAFADIESDGFTVMRRSFGRNGYVSEISNSTVMYVNGQRTYEVYLTAVKDMPGRPHPYISRLSVQLDVKDGIELSELPTGECRHGFIHKEVYPHTPETDDDSEEGSYTESGSAYFFKTIKHEMSLQTGPIKTAVTGPELSLEDANAFLRELLGCAVDKDATQKAYEESVKNRKSRNNFLNEVSSIHWNKEKPGEMIRFFSV